MKRNGFTLVEAMAVLSIVFVAAGITVSMYRKFLASTELRDASMTLYNEMSNLHLIARQYDAKVFIKFFAAQCSVYVDTNNSGTSDASDIKRVIKFPAAVSLSANPSGISTKPDDLSALAGMAGNWSSQATIKNDAVGTINDGAVYLLSNKLGNTAYCIGILAPMLSIKKYKWGGSAWSGI